ncbi:MAG: hypothetical protein JWN12_749 [Candidatus Saccharibacteria bacterium]|nr:hypothetical protein [Candidatus Saccharibacteria bacterium]
MNELLHEHTPDTTAFLTATLKAIEHEYDYVIAKVGQQQLLQDMDQKKMARVVIGLLDQTDLDAFQEDEERRTESDDSMNISVSDEASLEHLRLLADVLGNINGYRLTLITDGKIILDQTVRTKDACLLVISLEASLSPLGIYVAKDRHIALDGHAVMKDVLEVGPEDIAVVDQFIQKIIELK